MADSSITHPRLGVIRLVASSRAKRLSLTVRPSGEVRLTFPGWVGEKRALAFLEGRVEWVEQARERLARRRAENPPKEYSAQEIEALRSRAHEVLPGRVATLAAEFGFRYGRITIRAARTKWGCCTSKNNLSLSLFLMILPDHLRDFVLLHELCHTRHHNHSAAFHALLDRCLAGRERDLQRELKQYSIR